MPRPVADRREGKRAGAQPGEFGLPGNASTILLECSEGCGTRLDVKREPYDYPEAVRMTMKCPDCWGGDFDEPSYFDAAGKPVEYDPDLIPSRRTPNRED